MNNRGAEVGSRSLMRGVLECFIAGVIAASVATAQGQFQGSVPSGAPSATPLALTLHDAIDRGLRSNLGLLVSNSVSEAARGQRLQALSALLPQLDARVSETIQQINLATLGVDIHIPGVNIPSIAGPFHYTDARASGRWTLYDGSARKNYRASEENRRAAQLSAMDARDLVVQATANVYLQIIADASRIEAIQSQVETAQALYDRSGNQLKAGTAAAIDVLRAEVELKQQQQRLLGQQNQFEKDKLTLGRVIGLPDGQDFHLAENVPFAPLTLITLEQALETAPKQRPDYQSADARVRAADDAVRAAQAERHPTGGVTADYGDAGTSPNNSHGTFTFTASASINLFDGRRIEGDIVQAKAALKQRQDELADLRAQIAYQVRTAFLDIRTAADQVTVANDNLALANQALVQARDRFTAGVTDNIEVVQAQESVATGNDQLILALFAHNSGKVELARALGGAEQGIQRVLEVK
jgi:outer membrane protein TolC